MKIKLLDWYDDSVLCKEKENAHKFSYKIQFPWMVKKKRWTRDMFWEFLFFSPGNSKIKFE